jgi:hypothetical protein
LSFTRFAAAQSAAQLATRRLLLDQAQHARDSGDHPRALELAVAAGQIQMTPSVRMFIAEEQRTLGRMAPALGTADACTREAERDSGSRSRDAILSRCRQLVDELRHVVGSVTVRVASPRPDGLRISVAGEAIDASAIGLPYVVTAGHVVVEATAPGYEAFHREIEIAAGSSGDVNVALTPVVTQTTASAAPTPQPTERHVAVASTSTPAPTPVAEHPARRVTHWPVGGFVVAGAGVLALGAAGLFYGLRANAIADCTSINGTLNCPVSDMDRVSSELPTWTIATDVALGVGGLALAAGALWLIAGRSTETVTESPRVFLVPEPHGGMISIGGAM